MSRGMNTELMRRLWIKLNCWPETVSLHKKEKEASTHFMSILLFTIISMSENERRHNAKSVMSGLSHFYRPAPLSADQLLRKTRPIVEIKQLQCIVCVTKLRPMLKANYIIVMYRAVSGRNVPIVSVMQLDSIQRKLMKIFRVDLTASEYTTHYKNQFSLCYSYRPQHQL